MLSGCVVYEGPSRLDRAPLVVIATGLNGDSKNSKTGGMAQFYILRADINPLEAIEAGKDDSICGACVHRGTVFTPDYVRPLRRTCYVQVRKAPLAIYRAYKRGIYPTLTSPEVGRILQDNDVTARFGAYGDPAMVPLRVWEPIHRRVRGWTSYTHQWMTLPNRAKWAAFCMASVESLAEKKLANRLGYRTFRVVKSYEDLEPDEVMCANDTHDVQCEDCLICCGQRKAAKNFAVLVHGAGAKLFQS